MGSETQWNFSCIDDQYPTVTKDHDDDGGAVGLLYSGNADKGHS
jgi:hypothetical protein